MKSSACCKRAFGSAQLKRKKPAPAWPKHSPPKQAMPNLSSAPSNMNSARPWLVTPSLLQKRAKAVDAVQTFGQQHDLLAELQHHLVTFFPIASERGGSRELHDRRRARQ